MSLFEDLILEKFGEGFDSGVQYESGSVVVPTATEPKATSKLTSIEIKFPNFIEVTSKDIFVDQFVERRLQKAARQKLPNGERPISQWKQIWQTIKRLPT